MAGLDYAKHAPHAVVPFFDEDADTAKFPSSSKLETESAKLCETTSSTTPSSDDSEKLKVAPPSADREDRLSRKVTLYAEPSQLLPFLLAQFESHGGRIIISTVTSLDQLTEYDVIVNCTGLGARELFGDVGLRPVRGQLVRVRAPFVKKFLAKGGFYIVPNDELVVLGGTAQLDDWRSASDAADSARILAGCARLIPALKHAPVVSAWAGLRPFRAGGVRLESERHLVAGRWRHVVHNYGHGGAGVTLFWGCALEVAELVRRLLLTPPAVSKL